MPASSRPKAVLSRTVMCGISAKDWNTMLMSLRRRARSLASVWPLMSSPSITMRPAVGSIRPVEQPHERRLARAREAHDHEDLAGLDLEGRVEHADRLAAAREDLLLGEPLAHEREGVFRVVAEDLEDVIDVDGLGHVPGSFGEGVDRSPRPDETGRRSRHQPRGLPTQALKTTTAKKPVPAGGASGGRRAWSRGAAWKPGVAMGPEEPAGMPGPTGRTCTATGFEDPRVVRGRSSKFMRAGNPNSS